MGTELHVFLEFNYYHSPQEQEIPFKNPGFDIAHSY